MAFKPFLLQEACIAHSIEFLSKMISITLSFKIEATHLFYYDTLFS